MGDRAPQSQPEEQYPLLKIDGAGDINPQPTQSVMSPSWGVTCTNKLTRFTRWPEFISACWMTLILCGISFLIFYALGMGVYRRHQFVIVKCNNSRPASNVFYHHVVPRGSSIPFVLYTEYLANMALQYPFLHFNVVFLIDDSDTFRSLRRNIPYYLLPTGYYKLDEINKDALNEFQRRYQNVNITIVLLSKYIAMTPLRFKWRLIPIGHLPFYIRVVSVWQNGGIGIDLRTFNNDYHSHHTTDPRVSAILKQHNDGINSEDYANALNTIDKDEENAVFTMFYGIVNHFLNETRSFLNRTLSFPTVSNDKTPLTRTHRSKRQISNDTENTVRNGTSDDVNISDINSSDLKVILANYTNENNNNIKVLKNSTADHGTKSEIATNIHHSKVNGNCSKMHQLVLFYDFSILSDDIGPSYHLTEPFNQPVISSVVKSSDAVKPSQPSKTVSHLLSVDSEGIFVAASSKLHPFLGHVISAGSLRMPPKFAIQDALLTQCSGIFREDVYCNNIYIL